MNCWQVNWLAVHIVRTLERLTQFNHRKNVTKKKKEEEKRDKIQLCSKGIWLAIKLYFPSTWSRVCLMVAVSYKLSFIYFKELTEESTCGVVSSVCFKFLDLFVLLSLEWCYRVISWFNGSKGFCEGSSVMVYGCICVIYKVWRLIRVWNL